MLPFDTVDFGLEGVKSIRNRGDIGWSVRWLPVGWCPMWIVSIRDMVDNRSKEQVVIVDERSRSRCR